MSILRSTKNNAWDVRGRRSISRSARTIVECVWCQNSHFTEWIRRSTTTRKFITQPVRLVFLILLRTMREMLAEELVFFVLLRTTREMCTEEWVFFVLLRTTRGMRMVLKFALHWMNSRIDNDSWIHYMTRTSCTDRQPVLGALSRSLLKKL